MLSRRAGQVFASVIWIPTVVASTLAAQQTACIEVVRPPSTIIQVGELFNAPAIIRVKDDSGNPRTGVPVFVSITSGGGWVEGPDSVMTDDDGIARFTDLEIYGTVGDRILQFSAGACLSDFVPISLASGEPFSVEVRQQPSHAILGDSILKVQPLVVVRDAGRNPLFKRPVTARLIYFPNDSTKLDGTGAQLLGVTTVETNEAGLAEFGDLAISASQGRWKLEFSVPSYSVWGCPDSERAAADSASIAIAPCRYGAITTLSQPVSYEPDFSMNKSYVIVSLIKSIAGDIPRNEFFDIRFRLRVSESFFFLSNIDVSLSNRESTDSISSDTRKLTEASFSANVSCCDRRTPIQIPERNLYFGVMMKVFNTIPYGGITLGGVELGGSQFYGTSTSLSLLHRFSMAKDSIDGKLIRPQRYNLFFDFFVRSRGLDFFRNFSLRGGILLPIEKNARLQSRIAITVPFGTLDF